MKIEKPRRYRAILLRPGNDISELHFFLIAGNPYTALTSMNWMQERGQPDGLFLQFENMLIVERMQARRQARGTFDDEFEGSNMYHHESLWEFYKAVGYDHKKKRWTNPNLSTPINV